MDTDKKENKMSKIFVATFHGDLERNLENPGPRVNNSIESLLQDLKEEFGWGKVKGEICCQHVCMDGNCESIYHETNITPDPEDDKVEIWQFDTDDKSAQIVWGFWGWHWQIPENLEQGENAKSQFISL